MADFEKFVKEALEEGMTPEDFTDHLMEALNTCRENVNKNFSKELPKTMEKTFNDRRKENAPIDYGDAAAILAIAYLNENKDEVWDVKKSGTFLDAMAETLPKLAKSYNMVDKTVTGLFKMGANVIPINSKKQDDQGNTAKNPLEALDKALAEFLRTID